MAVRLSSLFLMNTTVMKDTPKTMSYEYYYYERRHHSL